MTLTAKVTLFSTLPPKECGCKHQLTGTGSVFFQSVGLIYCTRCNGWQLIKRPVQ